MLLTLAGQQLFPSDNPWNQKITSAPVAANSAAVMNAITTTFGNGRLHPDFGQDYRDSSDLYGIPYNLVHGNSVAKTHVVVDGYPGESDLQDVPLPANVVLEGDYQNGPKAGLANRGDSHLLVYDADNNIAYEFYGTSRPSENADGKWHAACEAVWDMKTNTFRPIGWTSADAAGLSLLAGLVRPDEALPASQGGQGVITHAIRVTLTNSVILNQFIYPASHVANPGNTNAATQPPMGARFRLKASVDISTLNPEAKIIAQAMKDYGLIVADNGSNFFFSGASYTVDGGNQYALTWNDNDIQDTVHGLKSLHYGDFEMVDLTPVVSGLSVASATAGAQITITGQNFSGAAGRLKVLFGATAATSVVVVDDSHVLAAVPAGSGTVDVRVQSGISDSGDTQNIKNPIFGYGASATSSADRFTFLADTTPPTVSSVMINDGNVQRSMVNTVTVTFSEAVTLAGGALQILTSTGAAVPGITVQLTNPGGDGIHWQLAFGASLPDGAYKVKATAAGVADLAGNHLAANFSQKYHRLFGDTDGDRDVDAADLARMKLALSNPANYVWWLDYNGDSLINSSDYAQFRKRLLKRLL